MLALEAEPASPTSGADALPRRLLGGERRLPPRLALPAAPLARLARKEVDDVSRGHKLADPVGVRAARVQAQGRVRGAACPDDAARAARPRLDARPFAAVDIEPLAVQRAGRDARARGPHRCRIDAAAAPGAAATPFCLQHHSPPHIR